MPGQDRPRLDRVDRPAAHAGRSCIEAAADPATPDPDRDSGRVLAILAGDRRRVVEVGTAIGYSTLWMALAQPDDGTIVTIDPDRVRTDRRPRVLAARRHRRRADHGRQCPGARRLRGRRPALAGPFDLAFIDALKEEYSAYLDALVPGSRRARSSSPTTCCGAAGRPAPAAARRRRHRRARALLRAGRRRPALHGHDPADRRRAPRGAYRGDGAGAYPRARPALRDPARAGRDPRGRRRPGRTAPRSPMPGRRSSPGTRSWRRASHSRARSRRGPRARGGAEPAGRRATGALGEQEALLEGERGSNRALRASWSWRLTGPARTLLDRLRNARG